MKVPFFPVTSRQMNLAQTIAIVVTLVYSASQFHKSNSAYEQQEYSAIYQQQHEIFKLQIEYADTYVKSLQEPEKLTPMEVWRIAEIVYMRLEFLERLQKAVDSGILRDSKVLETEYSDTKIYLGTPLGRVIWRVARGDYNDEKFVQRIESALRSTKVKSDNDFMAKLMSEFVQEIKKEQSPAK